MSPNMCLRCLRSISPLQGSSLLFGYLVQGRRATRLPLAVIFRAFGADWILRINGAASESEYVRHSPGEIVLRRREVDLNSVQSQTCRFIAEDVREHSIAFEQVAQGPLRIAGPGEKSPRRSAASLDHCVSKVGRRKEPDGTTGYGEKRLDEVWQQSKPVNDDAGLAWETEQVFDDQIEAHAAEPVKRLEHRFWRSIHPSLVHIHRHEPM